MHFLNAMSAVCLSVRRAAEEFHVPKSTLHDRLCGKHLPGLRSRPERYLSDEEENELEEGCASVGLRNHASK